MLYDREPNATAPYFRRQFRSQFPSMLLFRHFSGILRGLKQREREGGREGVGEVREEQRDEIDEREDRGKISRTPGQRDRTHRVSSLARKRDSAHPEGPINFSPTYMPPPPFKFPSLFPSFSLSLARLLLSSSFQFFIFSISSFFSSFSFLQKPFDEPR